MSKQWTIIVGVVAGVLALCLVGLVGVTIGRASSFAAMNRAGVGMQNPRGFEQPGQIERGGRFNQNPQAENRELEVTLFDDDEDGIPDRGVVEMPAGPAFNGGFDGKFNNRGGPPQNFGRGLDPGQRQFNRVPFLPLAPLAGLLCLSALGGLAVVGVVLYRRRPSPSPVAATSPIVDMPTEEINTPDETPAQEKLDEVDVPEDVETESDVENSDDNELPTTDDDEADTDTPSN